MKMSIMSYAFLAMTTSSFCLYARGSSVIQEVCIDEASECINNLKEFDRKVKGAEMVLDCISVSNQSAGYYKDGKFNSRSSTKNPSGSLSKIFIKAGDQVHAIDKKYEILRPEDCPSPYGGSSYDYDSKLGYANEIAQYRLVTETSTSKGNISIYEDPLDANHYVVLRQNVYATQSSISTSHMVYSCKKTNLSIYTDIKNDIKKNIHPNCIEHMKMHQKSFDEHRKKTKQRVKEKGGPIRIGGEN